jgi:hypothetical protein
MVGVAANFPDGELGLQHLAIQLGQDDNDALLILLKSCKTLMSLHVKMNFLPDSVLFLQRIEPHGQPLRT